MLKTASFAAQEAVMVILFSPRRNQDEMTESCCGSWAVGSWHDFSAWLQWQPFVGCKGQEMLQ
jgi:hypothetical protein